MRHACNVLLLAALAALAALALMATSTFAQSIEVHPENNSTHCSDVNEGLNHVVLGGCLIHVTGEDLFQTFQHIPGSGEIQTAACSSEFSGRVNEDGSGYFRPTDATFNVGCAITPCDERSPPEPLNDHDEFEWPISNLFEYQIGREAMVVTFCVRAVNQSEGFGNSFCTVIVYITQIAGHRQEYTALDAPCWETDGATELTGHWLSEETLNSGLGEVDIQMEHIHYP